MGRIDIPWKDYFKQPYVMANLAEVFLFNRNAYLKETDVSIQDSVQAKLGSNGTKDKDLTNDVHSRITLNKEGFEIPVHFTVELMANPDTAMVVRTMEYDINCLIVQIRRIESKMEHDRLVNDPKTCDFLTQRPPVIQLEPCITYMLNLNQNRWEGYTSSDQMYDHRLNSTGIHPTTSGVLKVIDPHTLSDRQLDLLIPELKLLFLIVRYQNKEYAQQLDHLLNNSKQRIGRNLAKVIAALVNRKIKIPKKGETIVMCEAMMVIEEKIRTESRFETALSFFRKGKLSAEDAAEEVGMSVEQFLAKAKAQMS